MRTVEDEKRANSETKRQADPTSEEKATGEGSHVCMYVPSLISRPPGLPDLPWGNMHLSKRAPSGCCCNAATLRLLLPAPVASVHRTDARTLGVCRRSNTRGVQILRLLLGVAPSTRAMTFQERCKLTSRVVGL